MALLRFGGLIHGVQLRAGCLRKATFRSFHYLGYGLGPRRILLAENLAGSSHFLDEIPKIASKLYQRGCFGPQNRFIFPSRTRKETLSGSGSLLGWTHEGGALVLLENSLKSTILT